jgi:hypothetical protein
VVDPMRTWPAGTDLRRKPHRSGFAVRRDGLWMPHYCQGSGAPGRGADTRGSPRTGPRLQSPHSCPMSGCPRSAGRKRPAPGSGSQD